MGKGPENIAPEGQAAAGWICERWREADQVLMDDRKNYWLNYSFYEGEQWIYWNAGHQEVAQFPRQGRIQAVDNRVAPNTTINHARLLQRKLVFEVQPDGIDDASLQGARLAEHLLEAERLNGHWEDHRRVNLFNVDMGGTAGILVEWDPKMGKPLGEGEDGEIVYEGGVRLTTLSITEFTVEAGSMAWHDSGHLIVCKAMTPQQAVQHYGLDFTPDADVNSGSGPLMRRLVSKRTGSINAKLCLVYTYYERPSTANPEGRHLVVCNERVVLDEPWPFPFDCLPLAVFRQRVMAKRWTGTTALNDVRPLQVMYNQLKSNIAETAKMAATARLAVPDNSGLTEDDFTDQPGEMLFYAGESQRPGYIDAAQIPRWIRDEIVDLRNSIDDSMMVHAISRGIAPGDRNSGLALSVLAEKDQTPMGLFAADQANGWQLIGRLVLEMLEANVHEYRNAVVNTEQRMPIARQWTGAHIRGQSNVYVPLEAVLPYSKAAQQAWMLNLATQLPNLLPISNPGAMARLLELPDSESYLAAVDPDAASAQLENSLMANGELVLPLPFENHGKHIAEHNVMRKSAAYRFMDPQMRQVLDDHVTAHEQLAAEQAANQASLQAAAPGAETIPQADQPPGSMVPPSMSERQFAAQQGVAAQVAPNPNAMGDAAPMPS